MSSGTGLEASTGAASSPNEAPTGAERHMSLGDFYRGFFYITWLLWTLIWLVLAFNVKVTVRRQAALPRLVNMALLIGAAVLLGAPHLPVSGLTVPVLPGSQWKIWTAGGAVLTLFGLSFTVWARIYLGRNWSGVAAIKADHELVVGGPYRWVRHPIYSGLALAFLGTALAIEQWRGMLALELALLAFGHRIIVEERFMRQQFGAVYDAYAQRVRALVPGLI
jgi:protein-S-isoprenylcysteine O-methyltransferase Ste14